MQRFYGAAGDYVPADIDPDRYAVPGMQRLDLMGMTDEKRFDRIYASHVMEHVPDDAVVLRNLLRALKPRGGFAIQTVLLSTFSPLLSSFPACVLCRGALSSPLSRTGPDAPARRGRLGPIRPGRAAD